MVGVPVLRLGLDVLEELAGEVRFGVDAEVAALAVVLGVEGEARALRPAPVEIGLELFFICLEF